MRSVNLLSDPGVPTGHGPSPEWLREGRRGVMGRVPPFLGAMVRAWWICVDRGQLLAD